MVSEADLRHHVRVGAADDSAIDDETGPEKESDVEHGVDAGLRGDEVDSEHRASLR